MKKNSPGCNCCGRVLVWCMGAMEGFWSGSDRNAGTWFYNYSAGNQYELIFDDAEVHYAVPPSILQLASFPRDPTFWQRNPSFSPYDDHDDLPGFWTRNIFDYDLIIWESPYADSDLDTEVIQPVCPDEDLDFLYTPVGEADHDRFGGLPQWWEDVAEGTWSGRVLIESPWSPTSDFINEDGFIRGGLDGMFGHPGLAFIDSLSAVTGMTLEANWILNDRVGPTFPVVTSVANDLTAGLAGGYSEAAGTRVDGGEDVMFLTAAFHDHACEGVDVNATFRTVSFAQRNTITVEVDGVDYLKDFVIKTARLRSAPEVPAVNVGQDVDLVRPFYKRCLQSPISNDHTLPGT